MDFWITKGQHSKIKISNILLYLLPFTFLLLQSFPVNANPPNQSDNTGTNIWNNTAPRFGSGSKLDPEIINTARRLSKDLDDAYAACVASAEAFAKLPRRFARGAAISPVDCNTPECQRLNSLLEETKRFISSLDSLEAERLRASGALEIW
ncbi:hypothetical protein H6F74_05975 [Trichocoleus sp. FACHB-90]|uniref:hypothetical protein n=1 Tax=Cyanophyceae TaxID=3028117 RepID=UPI0016820B6E|nr:hypothetical protein [Trichocoleus sp. FACHB-90]MBD1925832.1 hypothetical protein [Trichocoleus sp. FACHB-90]